MTENEKAQVRYFRAEGVGYRTIAAKTGLSENTVKSFCRRNGLSGIAKPEPVLACRQCGQPLAQKPKRNGRKFCSDTCRRTWWKEHPELIIRKAFYTLICTHCGNEFLSYGNKKRKYCCHACYVAARFGEQSPKLLICEYCGREFPVYSNAKRKYCGNPCYIAARYGKEPDTMKGGTAYGKTNKKN